MIKKQDFQKLKQLDRIEYMLKRNSIDYMPTHWTVGFVNTFALLFGFLTLLLVGSYSVTNELFFAVARCIKLLASMVIPFILLGLLVDLYSRYRYIKAKKELNAEFFKIDINVRSAKK